MSYYELLSALESCHRVGPTLRWSMQRDAASAHMRLMSWAGQDTTDTAFVLVSGPYTPDHLRGAALRLVRHWRPIRNDFYEPED